MFCGVLQIIEANDNSNAKRNKTTEFGEGNEKSGQAKTEEEIAKGTSGGDEKQTKTSPKPPEPPKDYIHVRARRGQATDSHSLAERVRNFYFFSFLFLFFLKLCLIEPLLHCRKVGLILLLTLLSTKNVMNRSEGRRSVKE